MAIQLELFPKTKEEQEYEDEYETWVDSFIQNFEDTQEEVRADLLSNREENFDWQEAIDDNDTPF